MKNFLILPVLLTAPLLSGSTLVTVICNAADVHITQSDPASTGCSASDPPIPGLATASGAVGVGSASGQAYVDSLGSGEASVTSSFDWAFTSITTITWDISVDYGDGPWGHLTLDLAGLNAQFCGPMGGQVPPPCLNPYPTWSGTITQTLGPGDYTFSAYDYVSDEGIANFTLTGSASDPPGDAPEPGTIGMVLAAAALIRELRRKDGRSLKGLR